MGPRAPRGALALRGAATSRRGAAAMRGSRLSGSGLGRSARIRMWVVGLWGACAEREHKTTVKLYVRERVYTCQTPVRTKKLLGRVYFSLANREHRWMPSRRYAWRHACRARCVCECAARERASQSKARNDTGARWIRSRSVSPQCTACAQKQRREREMRKRISDCLVPVTPGWRSLIFV